MDMSKVNQGQLIAGIGGVILVVSVFLHWGGGVSAWDAFSAMHIIMLLVGLAAIALAVIPGTGATVAVPASAPLIVAALGVAVFGFALGWEFEASGEIGVWLAILGSLCIAYGGYESSRTPVAPVARRPVTPPPTTPAV